MKIYVTQYALTKGILERDADINGEMAIVKGSYYSETYFKPFWYTSKKEAIKHAEILWKKKIISLREQINRLENLRFE